MNDYPITDAMQERLDKDYSYHAPTASQPERYVFIRAEAKKLAENLVRNCPQSRELSVALTHLDEVVMNANAAIARNEK